MNIENLLVVIASHENHMKQKRHVLILHQQLDCFKLIASNCMLL